METILGIIFLSVLFVLPVILIIRCIFDLKVEGGAEDEERQKRDQIKHQEWIDHHWDKNNTSR